MSARRAVVALLSGALALSALAAPAQETETPRVRARIEPERAVLVGEPARLLVDVLTPTWFLSAPQLPDLEVEGALVRLEERGLNLSERVDGATWTGVRRTYVVTPMRRGVLEVPGFEVTVVYAIDARRSEPTPLRTAPVRIEARVPEAAAGLDYFVPAARLELSQTLEPEPGGLRVGDALRRTLTVDAVGAFAMILPPLALAAPESATAYPDPPRVEDRPGERGAPRQARRVEAV